MIPPTATSVVLGTAGAFVILHSLDDAARYLRSHLECEYSEILIDQIEAAKSPELEKRAWRAFVTFLYLFDRPRNTLLLLAQ